MAGVAISIPGLGSEQGLQGPHCSHSPPRPGNFSKQFVKPYMRVPILGTEPERSGTPCPCGE